MARKINKTKLGISIFILIILITAIIVLTKTEQSDSIKIGVSTGITGPAAFIGQDYLLGLETALEEINEYGITGKKLELIIEDNKNNAAEGTTVFQSLKFKGVDMIITTLSPPSVSLSPLAKDNNIPLFVSVVFADITSSNPNSISFFPTPFDDAKATVKDMKKQEIKSAAVLYLNTEYGKASAEAFKEESSKNNINIVAIEAFTGDVTDFSTPLLKLKEKNPDAIYIASINAIPIIKQLKIMDNKIGIYTNLIPVFGSLVYKEPEVFENVHLTAPRVALKGTDEYNSFRGKLGNKLPKEKVSLGYASIAYDNLHSIAKVLDKNENIDEFVKTFSKYGEFTGVNGKSNLNGRNVGMELYPVIFRKGELIQV